MANKPCSTSKKGVTCVPQLKSTWITETFSHNKLLIKYWDMHHVVLSTLNPRQVEEGNICKRLLLKNEINIYPALTPSWESQTAGLWDSERESVRREWDVLYLCVNVAASAHLLHFSQLRWAALWQKHAPQHNTSLSTDVCVWERKGKRKKRKKQIKVSRLVIRT